MCLSAGLVLAVVLSGCNHSKPSAAAAPAPPPKVVAKQAPPAPPKPAGPHFDRPKKIKGIYVTAFIAGYPARFEKLLSLVDRTEINAMVIDIRDDGNIFWKTNIPLAKESKATLLGVVKPKRLFDSLEKHQVWPIARIACFRDHFVPAKFPNRGIELSNGKPWRDRSGHTWLDPYNKENWNYIAQVVDFALDQGFPEIQLDYVRFASEGKASTQVFPSRKSFGDGKVKPEDVIQQFAEFIGKRVHDRGALFSVDCFGIISSTKKGDQGIGQVLEKVVVPFDVVSPMIYPSHFAKGEYKIADPNRQPYEIIKKSLTDFKARIPKKDLRPWLQDFSLGYPYGAKEVKAQIKAAHDLGIDEYLLWNAANRYTEAALAPEKPDSTAKPAQTSSSKQETPTKP